MSTVPNYPLPYDPSDDRLSDRLVEAVADLLADRSYGFPFIGGPDLDRLREALRGFLYEAPAVDTGWTCGECGLPIAGDPVVTSCPRCSR